MLLDEADIFLAQRATTDVQRNAQYPVCYILDCMVPWTDGVPRIVFLRVLEYYEGILFLTTNRVGISDEAFKSRIHISLYYPPLNWQQTEKI